MKLANLYKASWKLLKRMYMPMRDGLVTVERIRVGGVTEKSK